MSPGNSSYYDRYGYQGSEDIVCVDCKQDGRDVPVILVDSEKRSLHFRHRQGEAPDGLGRQRETAEHLRGKHLIMDWAREKYHVLPWSIEEECPAAERREGGSRQRPAARIRGSAHADGTELRSNSSVASATWRLREFSIEI